MRRDGLAIYSIGPSLILLQLEEENERLKLRVEELEQELSQLKAQKS